MQRLGLDIGLSTPSVSVKKVYEALYEAEPKASIAEALEVLFHGVGIESRRHERKCKPAS